jgi:hypothetical protein
MKIYVEKKGNKYHVYSPDLNAVNINEKINYPFPNDLEATDEQAEYAIDNFNSGLSDFIEYYYFECKGSKDKIFDLFRTIEYIFDMPSVFNRYLDNSIVYGEDENDDYDKNERKNKPSDIASRKTQLEDYKVFNKDRLYISKVDSSISNFPITEDMPNEVGVFYEKNIAVIGNPFTKSFNTVLKKIQEVKAISQTRIKENTDFVISLKGKPLSDIYIKKIDQYNATGASIKIIAESEFLAMIK